ncbi:MAG: cysteine--tRNA ligase [Patescibacteria group bacterium]|nr:cysteine--tRNA ligase [Patescibacteria group bacterium]
MLKLYDTYKKKLVIFKPIKKGKVTLYNCGPTVYYYLQIGNLRSYVFRDVLYRTLKYLGYDVTQAINITDVGHLTMTDEQKLAAIKPGEKLENTDTEDGLDRMEKTAKQEGITVWDVAKKYTDAIFGKGWEKRKTLGLDGDLGKMNIVRYDFLPKATDYIKEQIDYIKVLEKKGFTYKTKEAVYFDISKFPKYEKLTGQKFEDMKRGESAHEADPERKHPADFRLWQLNQPDHAMQWDSPWGRGYPGWHIECSAMARDLLGQPVDIHTGGEDHIKVHHPAEMAQAESAYERPMANYWLHNAFLTVDGGKMGKSLGNAYTMQDVLDKGFDPMDLRYFYLQAHYRSKQNFTWKNLKDAMLSRKVLVKRVKELKKLAGNKAGVVLLTWDKEFIKAIEDDLNTPRAIAVARIMTKKGLSSGSKEKAEDILTTLLEFDKVFGLRLNEIVSENEDIDKEIRKAIERLIEERKKAREDKDWKKSDELREKLLKEYGVKVEDTEEGVKWELETENSKTIV